MIELVCFLTTFFQLRPMMVKGWQLSVGLKIEIAKLKPQAIVSTSRSPFAQRRNRKAHKVQKVSSFGSNRVVERCW